MDNVAIAPYYESSKKTVMWKWKWKKRFTKKGPVNQKEFHIVSFPVDVAEEVARAILKACGAEETMIDYKKEDIDEGFEKFASEYLP